MKFSERYGYTEPKRMQREFMDEDLRNGLWNLLICKYDSDLNDLVFFIWISCYNKPVDEVPQNKSRNYDAPKYDKYYIKNLILKEEWFNVLDIIEFTSKHLFNTTGSKEEFQNDCNELFKKEGFAYRFVNEYIAEITSEEEIKEIEKASQIKVSEIEVSEIQEHINTALYHWSRKNKPDYRNSIKESISAVECLCRKITKKNTLGEALKEIKNKKIIEFQDPFGPGLEKIYGWTNGDGGIRHALMDNSEIKQEDARFMLILCSSFINYISEKAFSSNIRLA